MIFKIQAYVDADHYTDDLHSRQGLLWNWPFPMSNWMHKKRACPDVGQALDRSPKIDLVLSVLETYSLSLSDSGSALSPF
jgi:hypothetical protein